MAAWYFCRILRRICEVTDNPYQSPDSNVRSGPDAKARPVRGIVIGFIIDVAGTFIGIALIAIIYVAAMAYSGKSRDEIDHVLSTNDPTALFNVMVALWGVLMSCIGGYFCITISRGRDFNYPVVLGALVFVFGVVTSWQALDIAEILFWSTCSFGATIYGAQRALGGR